jgi:hypothetical protein
LKQWLSNFFAERRQKMFFKNGLLIALIVCSIGPGRAWSAGTESLAELNQQLEMLKQEIAEEEKLWAEEKSREQDSEKRREQRYQDFQKEKMELKQSLEKSVRDMEKAMAKLESLKGSKRAYDADFKRMGRELLELTVQLEEKIHGDFPHEKSKRIESVALLASDLRQEKISPEEGFSRLWSLYQKEISMASEAEVFGGEITDATGREVSVKYLRVGKQMMAYADPSGSHLGWLKKSPEGWEWLDEKSMDYDMRQSVRNMIAVAEGKATPGFVSAPLSLSEIAGEQVIVKDSLEATEPNQSPKKVEQ